MRNSSTAISAGLAVAAFGAALAFAAPARATVSPSCDSGGSRFVCDLFTPMTSSAWSVNGAHISGFDNKTSISSPCLGGAVYSISVTWTYAGVTQTGSAGLRCSSAPWT